MCGILAIINKTKNLNAQHLVAASSIIRHRGPDDEGFLTWSPGEEPKVWAGADTASSTISKWGYSHIDPSQYYKVGFGHRRLSILDLSPLGHQPMLYAKAGLAISFNGEVYNYLEIKEELLRLGHEFYSTSDTEVILHAWEQWGPQCLNRFNGMFAIVILDHKRNQLFAARDRFGVKPLYYFEGANATYLTSEIKQIRTSPDYKFEPDMATAQHFLGYGVCEHEETTFYSNVKQVKGGFYLSIDLSKDNTKPQLTQWYELRPKAWKGSYDEAVGEFRRLLTDAVSLRLRSDVKVGSCLSGGLDSSSIVCIAADVLKSQGDFAGQETVTACYESAKYDEWHFAQEVIKKTNAKPHRVFPSFTDLQHEIDTFLWHQDQPTGSTSQFSQWAVFKGTHAAGLKVMIDGQGADEQLAGYQGNDIALYTGLLKKARLGALLSEAKSYKSEKGAWPKGFLLAAMQLSGGKAVTAILPGKLKIKPNTESWLPDAQMPVMLEGHATSLQENLLRQIYAEPLPSLLRYEDRNSMAWSVESRTPFMDYRLLEFNLGLPEEFVYQGRVRKRILRDAMHNIIPEAIENRRDKMGFVTPEELWLKGEGNSWFREEIEKACKQLGGVYFDSERARKYVNEMVEGKRHFDFMPWRIVAFRRWYENQ